MLCMQQWNLTSLLQDFILEMENCLDRLLLKENVLFKKRYLLIIDTVKGLSLRKKLVFVWNSILFPCKQSKYLSNLFTLFVLNGLIWQCFYSEVNFLAQK